MWEKTEYNMIKKKNNQFKPKPFMVEEEQKDKRKALEGIFNMYNNILKPYTNNDDLK